MTREMSPTTEDTVVPDYLIEQIDDAGEAVAADEVTRGAEQVHEQTGVGSFVKENVLDGTIQIEDIVSEEALYYFYNPAEHVKKMLGTEDRTSASQATAEEPRARRRSRNNQQTHTTSSEAPVARETTSTQEEGRFTGLAGNLGRAALMGWKKSTRSIKSTKHKAGNQRIEAVSHLPMTYSTEEAQERIRVRNDEFSQQDAVRAEEIQHLQETTPTVFRETVRVEREQPGESKLKRMWSGLGRAAMWAKDGTKNGVKNQVKAYKEAPRLRDIESSSNDNSRLRDRLKERFGSKDARTAGIGLTALAAVGLAFGGNAAMDIKEAIERHDMTFAGVTYAIEETHGVDTTILVMGGNKQWTPPKELVDIALDEGINVRGTNSIMEMGPLAGTIDAQTSINDSASTLVDELKALDAAGQHTGVLSYSWGTVVTAEAYHRIKMTDPELYDRLQPPVLYGAPLGPNGGFNGPFGKIAMGMFGVDPAIRDSLPKGTTFVYSDRDPFATSGYGQQPLTSGFNVLMSAVGSHGIQPEGSEYITIEDKNGNFHKITKFDAAAALGITGAGHDELNAAIEALFPVNNDPDSTERPDADAISAMFFGAQALDRMIDGGTGTFKLFEHIQAQIPEEWKKLIDNGVDGINDATMAVMEAVNNPTPENIQKAFNAVMSTIGTVLGDFKQAASRDMGTDIKSGTINVTAQMISENLGLDYNMVHQQVSSFANQIEMQAQAFAAQVKVKAQAYLESQKEVTINSTDTTLASSLPKFAAPNIVANLRTPVATAEVTTNANGTNASVETTNPYAGMKVTLPVNAPSSELPKAAVVTPAESSPSASASEQAQLVQQPSVLQPRVQTQESVPLAPAPAAAPATPAEAPVVPEQSQSVFAPVQAAPAAPERSVEIPAAPIEAPAPAPLQLPIAPAPAMPAAPAPAPIEAASPAPAPAPTPAPAPFKFPDLSKILPGISLPSSGEAPKSLFSFAPAGGGSGSSSSTPGISLDPDA